MSQSFTDLSVYVTDTSIHVDVHVDVHMDICISLTSQDNSASLYAFNELTKFMLQEQIKMYDKCRKMISQYTSVNL